VTVRVNKSKNEGIQCIERTSSILHESVSQWLFQEAGSTPIKLTYRDVTPPTYVWQGIKDTAEYSTGATGWHEQFTGSTQGGGRGSKESYLCRIAV